MTIDELKAKEAKLWQELQALNRVADRKRAEWMVAQCDVKDAEAEKQAEKAEPK